MQSRAETLGRDASRNRNAAQALAIESIPPSLAALYAPLLTSCEAPTRSAPSAADGCLVIGRLAQTLDGRIATASGHSRWIGGPGDILHTHRLRALCDAVVVGAGTVRQDDPRLTTRAVRGPNPVRVVLDTEGRLGPEFQLFQDGTPSLLACAEEVSPRCGAEALHLPRRGTGLCIASLLRSLAARGLRRVLVEGGGVTVSRFIAAGCLDRLHLTVAPLLLGSGIPAFALPPVLRVDEGLRVSWQAYALDADAPDASFAGDLLLDIVLRRARPANCD